MVTNVTINSDLFMILPILHKYLNTSNASFTAFTHCSQDSDSFECCNLSLISDGRRVEVGGTADFTSVSGDPFSMLEHCVSCAKLTTTSCPQWRMT